MASYHMCVNASLEICHYFDSPAACSFDADPDIAGIGVLLSFVISVSLAYILTVYGFYFIPNSYTLGILNTLDASIIDIAQKVVAKIPGHDKAVLTQETFREIILIFSDQQLVTGLAILVIGFAKLNVITEYHFALISDLSNMAFVVHISTIDILGQEFREHPQMMWWRIVGILIVAFLALVTSIPWGNQYFLYSYGVPTICVWRHMGGNYPPGERTANMVVYMLFQVWGIATILNEFFPRILDNKPMRCLFDAIARCVQLPRLAYVTIESRRTRLGTSATCWQLLSWLAYSLAFTTFVVVEIFDSQALELARNWAMLIVNVADVFDLTKKAGNQGRVGKENTWGFGQAMPMFLLILPIFTMFELVFDHRAQIKRAEREERQRKLAETNATTTPLHLNPRRSHAQKVVHQVATQLSVIGHLSKTARSPSPNTAAPLLPSNSMGSTATSRLSRTFYFGSLDENDLGPSPMELKLYDDTFWFKWFMALILACIFVAVTIGAFFGWAV